MEIYCAVIALGEDVPDDVQAMLRVAARADPAFEWPSAIVVGRAAARELVAVAVWPEGEAVPLVYVRDGLENRIHGTLSRVEFQLRGYAYSLCGRRAG